MPRDVDARQRANFSLSGADFSGPPRRILSLRPWAATAERLAEAEADLVSITEKIDTTTPVGRFFFTTIAALAQLERDQISERTVLALAHKRAHWQRVSGMIAYGYRLAEDGVRSPRCRRSR